MPAFSPTGIFLFLSLRSLRNAAARRLKRLKEPKYLIGFLFGLAYFWFLFIRPRVHAARSRTAREFSPEILALLLLAASAALALLFLLFWLLRKRQTGARPDRSGGPISLPRAPLFAIGPPLRAAAPPGRTPL